jgi:hypothetical protein
MALDWTTTVFEVIDMRSFSNLWYWLVLAAIWSTTSHWVLGVPYDMIQRARKNGGIAQEHLETITMINVERILYIGRVSGLWLLGLTSFLLTGLGLLAFAYDVEFAQALFLIAMPMTLVGALSLSTARLIETHNPSGAALHKRLFRHRLYTQIIGMISIFVTAMYGMYVNFSTSPLY